MGQIPYRKAVVLLIGVLMGGCSSAQPTPDSQAESVEEDAPDSQTAETEREAQAQMTSGYREPQGSVRLVERDGGVHVEVALENLDPGTYHLYVHEKTDCEPPNFRAGGGPMDKIDHQWKTHAGDLGEVVVGDDRKGQSAYTDEVITLEGDKYDVFGETLLLHKASGGPGTRKRPVACGVIWHKGELAAGALAPVPVAVDQSKVKSGATPEQALEQMAPEGWSVFDSATADLNADGEDDLIALIENDAAKDGAPGDAYPQHRDVLIVVGDQPAARLAVRSERLLRQRGQFGGSSANVKLDATKGEFSIAETGGRGGYRWTIEYTFAHRPALSAWTLAQCTSRRRSPGSSWRTEETEYPAGEEFGLENLDRRTFEGDCPK